jgi:hypothetical protein
MPEVNTTAPGAMSGVMDQLKGWFDDNPRLAKSLMAGLGSAAVGGGLTAMSKRKDETPAERRKRVLRNALLAGGAGAGAVGLGDFAMGEFKTVDPETRDPIMGPSRDIAALGGGASALGAANATGRLAQDRKRRGIITSMRDEVKKREAATKSVLVPGSEDSKKGPKYEKQPIPLNRSDQKIKNVLQDAPDGEAKGVRSLFTGGRSAQTLHDLANVAGPAGSKQSPFDSMLKSRAYTPKDLSDAGYVKGYAGKGDGGRYAKDLLKRELNTTFGRTPLKRLGRAGAIGASAAIPYALISTLMSSPDLAENTLGRYRSIKKPGLLESLK